MNKTKLLSSLTNPKAVALIGVSGDETRTTARPLRFLKKFGFSGAIYPVNPTRESVQGLPAYKCVQDLPEPVDHAYILLDRDRAVEAFEACVDAGSPASPSSPMALPTAARKAPHCNNACQSAPETPAF